MSDEYDPLEENKVLRGLLAVLAGRVGGTLSITQQELDVVAPMLLSSVIVEDVILIRVMRPMKKGNMQ